MGLVKERPGSVLILRCQRSDFFVFGITIGIHCGVPHSVPSFNAMHRPHKAVNVTQVKTLLSKNACGRQR